MTAEFEMGRVVTGVLEDLERHPEAVVGDEAVTPREVEKALEPVVAQ
jgi:hypothetical protein